jgi:hypothetical protein
MYVQVTRSAHVPLGTYHTYDGEGYGTTFEIEGYTPPGSTVAHIVDAHDESDDAAEKDIIIRK